MLDFETIKPYQDDLPLLKKLLLPIWSGKARQEIFVGEVRPYEEEENKNEITSIKIYVTGCPAQFFRFEIIRKADDEHYTGMERIEVNTGSGSLNEYWPMALAIANNCLTVGIATRLSH